MERTPIVLAWSGGKDSSLALAALMDDPRYEVVSLLTTIDADSGLVNAHGVDRQLIEEQALALDSRCDVPFDVHFMRTRPSNLRYESAFEMALAALSAMHSGLRHIAFGDLFLADVRNYRIALAARFGFDSVFPLWGMETQALSRELVRAGYRAVVTCVDTTQLDARFAGRAYDDAFLAELPSSVDPCGENGEFHTFVVDGPIFRRAIAVEPGERVLRDGRFMFCEFELA